MKIKYISELISAVSIGIMFGLLTNGMHVKWHGLGREAYMAHASQNFDKLYANPVSIMHLILLWVLIVLLIFVIYKGIAFVVAMLLLAIAEKSKTAQG